MISNCRDLPQTSTTSLLQILVFAACLNPACTPEEDPFINTPDELVAYIRAQTPTEIPPITSTGANTMGAWIETDTGRVLFVASGIERPDPIGAESTDCPAFQNVRYE